MSVPVNDSTETRAAAPRPLADIAYTAIRDRIVTLQLAPGTPLNEDALGSELGIGRTPLREAVKRLESESLVVIYPRRGTFVSEVNITDHGLIADVRRQLEGLAARRAAERATPGDREALRALMTEIRTDGGGRAERMRLDTAIHREVHRCTHNRYLATTLSQYYNLSLRIWYVFLDRLPEVDHTTEHLPMLEAIVAGDADRAAELAVAHVEHFERSVRAAV